MLRHVCLVHLFQDGIQLKDLSHSKAVHIIVDIMKVDLLRLLRAAEHCVRSGHVRLKGDLVEELLAAEEAPR